MLRMDEAGSATCNEAKREGAKPPLHALSGVLNFLSARLSHRMEAEELLLLLLLLFFLSGEREDRFGMAVALGYLLFSDGTA